MERRKFVIGLGSLAAGGAAAAGTGAFSNTQANRNVSLSVEGDKNAYLGIESKSEYVSYTSDSDGLIEIDFTETDNGGQGINRDATVTFSNLFEITNQGTETIAIWFDDGQEDIDATDQYWSDGNFNDKVDDQLEDGAGHPENYYNFFTDGEGETTFTDRDIAPDKIDTGLFDNPEDNGVILGSGDSADVGAYFGDTADFEPGEISDAKITIWAYSESYAESVQETAEE